MEISAKLKIGKSKLLMEIDMKSSTPPKNQRSQRLLNPPPTMSPQATESVEFLVLNQVYKIIKMLKMMQKCTKTL